MVGMTESGVWRVVIAGSNATLDNVFERDAYGYRCMLMKGSYFPYQLLYGVTPRIFPSDNYFGATHDDYRRKELLAALKPRMARADDEMQNLRTKSKAKSFQVEEFVLVEHGEVFRSLKWSAFKSK